MKKSTKLIMLKGTNVTLRQPRMSDAEALFGIASDREVSRYLPWVPHRRIEDSIEFISKAEKEMRIGTVLRLVIENNTDRSIAGMINLRVNRKHRRGEIGTWLGKRHWGTRINAEAKRLVLDYAFRKLKLNKVILRTISENIRSIRAIEKLGAKREALLRKHIFRKGRFHDMVAYSILREEYTPEKNEYLRG